VTTPTHLLAWAGWWLPLPEPWRFFAVEGTYGKGTLVLGDDERPRLELSWVWVTRRSLNPERFIHNLLLRGTPRQSRPGARSKIQFLSLPGFSTAAKLDGQGKCAGAGFCSKTNRLLHWVYHEGSTGEQDDFFGQTQHLWRDQPLDHAARWKFFDLDFSIPAGFRLHSAQLNLGDMQIVLLDPSTWGPKHRLCIRHIYPASLALARQPLEDWLREIFKKSREVYSASGSIELMHPANGSKDSLRQRARLHLLLRTFLRPLVLRRPSNMEASLHHVESLGKLLYLQIAASPERIELTRDHILRSLTPTKPHDA